MIPAIMSKSGSRRITRTVVGACLVALAALMWLSVPAGAGPLVDPSTLLPEPPPGAECKADGAWTICHTGLVVDLVNEPVFDLPCGTLYETSHDVRSGIRWYNDEGKLAKRFVTQDAEGSWSLSPTGAAPNVTISAHANWRNVYAIPGEDADGSPSTVHGDGFTAKGPNGGVIVHIAGIDLPDGTHRGVIRADAPEIIAAVCAALGG